MDIKQIVLDLCALSDEQEWFEFKENWFQPEALGEYVSALSNAAAFHYKKYAYFIWGVNDTTHEIVGTTFNQYCEYNKEPYQNYLARNLSPSINFSFEETEIYGKRVVGLVIPAATEIPTAFKEKRFLRIGSSKCNMKDYPKLDVLSMMKEIPVIVGYKKGNQEVTDFDPIEDLEEYVPIVRILPGWQTDISGCVTYDELPDAAKTYVETLEDLLQHEIQFISVGAERSQYLTKGEWL